jgi:hypothetical protein
MFARISPNPAEVALILGTVIRFSNKNVSIGEFIRIQECLPGYMPLPGLAVPAARIIAIYMEFRPWERCCRIAGSESSMLAV